MCHTRSQGKIDREREVEGEGCLKREREGKIDLSWFYIVAIVKALFCLFGLECFAFIALFIKLLQCDDDDGGQHVPQSVALATKWISHMINLPGNQRDDAGGGQGVGQKVTKQWAEIV